MQSSIKAIQQLERVRSGVTIRYGRCTKGSVLRTQKGFTLIELMIVVAIIGILAGIAVVSFGGTQAKTKARAEVVTIFAEFKIRQEQHMLENRRYVATGTSDTDSHPAAAPAADGSKTVLGTETDWTTLRMATDLSAVYCSYVAIIGSGTTASVGTIADGTFSFTAPAGDWYYLIAHCNMDSDTTVDSYYFQRSDDAQLYFVNQGN